MAEVGEGSVGPSTDRNNEPVVDPTKNVLDLVTAAIKRQDDLRVAEFARIDSALTGLEKTVNREFALVESRRVEQKVDTKVAVDAALNAAKEAVKEQTAASEKSITKSETSASEQSKQQNATFTASLKGVLDTVADLKDRVVKIESRKEGSGDLSKQLINIVGVIIAALILGVALYAALHK